MGPFEMFWQRATVCHRDSEQERHTCHQEKPREGGSRGLLPAPKDPSRRPLFFECHLVHISCGVGKVNWLRMSEMQEWEELMLTVTSPLPSSLHTDRTLKSGEVHPFHPQGYRASESHAGFPLVSGTVRSLRSGASSPSWMSSRDTEEQRRMKKRKSGEFYILSHGFVKNNLESK